MMEALETIVRLLVGVGVLVGIPAAIYFVKKKSGLGWSNIIGISIVVSWAVKYYFY